MRDKRRSIKTAVLFPVIALGLIAIISSVIGLYGISSVNNNAMVIADEHITGIEELNDIQSRIQNLEQMTLTHVLATSSDTMITLADSIKEQRNTIDQELEEYKIYVSEDMDSAYEKLVEDYSDLKHSIILLLAMSANSQTEDAYIYVNDVMNIYRDDIESDIDNLIDIVNIQTETYKDELELVYKNSTGINVIIIIVSIIVQIWAIYTVMRRVVKPVIDTEKELNNIIESIDARQGDLTKRIPIISNDEIAALAKGINLFMEKLQHIFGIISDNSAKMENVVDEVRGSVRTSSKSASDLSTLTDDLSSTMQEVSDNAARINDKTIAVNNEVNEIADSSIKINNYAREMKGRAIDMENSAKNNADVTSEKVNEILDVLNKAIAESESVEQVNTLTEEILTISSETNLLALNASIEAARAGETGKGFAVVANEIRQLADSTRDTANRIQNINAVVTGAVKNLADNANNLVGYMNDTILPEFDNLVSTGEQYMKDAAYIEDTMARFASKTDNLKVVMNDIANSINTITTSIDNGASGVVGAAQNTQILVKDMDNITERMDENFAIAGTLKQETSIFTNL